MSLRESLLLSVVLGCSPVDDASRSGASPAEEGARPNILLIDIDSLRSDRITWAEDGTTVAPNIMALASEGVRFPTVVVPSGWTLPSVVTLLAGRTPQSTLLATDEAQWDASATERLLPSILAAYGYHSGVGWGTTTLAQHNKAKEWFGGGAAEDLVDIDTYTERIGREVAEPFFHVLHDMDLHFIQDGTRRDGKASEGLTPMERKQAGLRRIREGYDGVLKSYDAKIGALVRALESAGLRERTIIVVTSNHGEELGDHAPQVIGHGRILFDTVATVPLVITAPSMATRGRVVETAVQLQDVAPTLLELARVPIHQQMSGVSLVSTFGEVAVLPPSRDGYTLTFRRAAALRTDHFKIVLHPVLCPEAEQRTFEPLEGELCERVFDLGEDPGELRDISKANPGLTRSLRDRLLTWVKERFEETPAKHDAAFRAELQKRGYWQAAGNSESEAEGVAVIRVDSMSVDVRVRAMPKVSAPTGKSAGQLASCRIRFIVDEEGVPKQVSTVICDKVFTEAVLEAAQKWRFKPWKADGKAVPFMVVKELRFNLEG